MIQEEQITQALRSSKILQAYDMPNLTSLEDYIPEELENMTYIYINPDDQSWSPGYEIKIPQEAQYYLAGLITINQVIYPIYIY